MTSLTCRRCGTAQPSGARFCGQCGSALQDETAAPGRYHGRPGGRLAGFAVAATIIGGIAGGAILLSAPSPTGNRAEAIPTFSPQPTPVGSPDITFEPLIPPAVPTLAGERTARIGERVAIIDVTGGRLGWVRITETVKYTSLRGLDAPSRWMWVGAKVEYLADAGLGYSDLDWLAHDDHGVRYEPTAFGREPVLGLGVLAAGVSTAGWIAFEVPRSARDLWAAFVNLDGGVVFSVPLF